MSAAHAAIPPGRAAPPDDAGDAAPAAYRARIHPTIASAEPVWRRMQAEGVASAYQDIDWAAGIVRHLVPHVAGRPLIVEVTDVRSGRPLMLVPLMIRRRPVWTAIEWLDLGVCDYAAPVMAAGVHFTAAEAQAAWQAVRAVLPDADLLRIGAIPGEVFGAANPLALLVRTRLSPERAFGIPLHGDAETLLRRICPQSFVRSMGQTRRRLARLGEVRFVAAATAAEADALFAILLAQRRRRFRELGRADLLERPHIADFYRASAREGIGGGTARLFGLSVAGEWIATAYGLVHGGAFHLLLLTMGEDRWRAVSPGLYMVAETMQWARRNGLHYYDMTVGAHAYKEKLGAHGHALHELVEPITPGGHLVVGVKAAIAAAKAWLHRHPAALERARAWRQAMRRRGAALRDGLRRRARPGEA